MKKAVATFVFLSMISFGEALAQLGSKRVKVQYEEVDFEDMMRRYFGKEEADVVEGIYSVSCVIERRKTGLFGGEERTKVMERKDNYARVAILKDWPGTKRDYIQVSLSYRDAKKYPIMGELHTLSEGQGFIYKHLEPDGSKYAFSMIKTSGALLEGEYSITERKKTITYKLSYLKMFPNVGEPTVFNRKP